MKISVKAQVCFKRIYGLFPLCCDDLYVEYAYDLCFYTIVHNDSQTWHIAWLSTKMTFLACFQGFYAWLSYLVHFYSNPYFSTFSPSVGIGTQFDSPRG